LKRDQHERHEAMARAQVAALARSEAGDHIADLAMGVLDRLVSLYRSGKLTHDQAIGGIAEITGLRNLRARIDSEIQDGQRAVAEEITLI
jgi:hypothetical protein